MLTGEWTGRKTATDCCKVVRQYTTVRWLCDFFSKARKPRNIDIARGTIIVGINHSNRYWILIYIIEDGCPAVHTRLSSVVSAMSFPSPSKNLRNARAMQSFSHNFLRMKWQVGVIPVLDVLGTTLGASCHWEHPSLRRTLVNRLTTAMKRGIPYRHRLSALRKSMTANQWNYG